MGINEGMHHGAGVYHTSLWTAPQKKNLESKQWKTQAEIELMSTGTTKSILLITRRERGVLLRNDYKSKLP